VDDGTEVIWSSSDQSIIFITSDGLATAISPGEVEISATALTPDEELVVSFNVVAGDVTTEAEVAQTRSGVIETTTFYDLEGDFVISVNDAGNLLLEIADNYQASASLPGLFVYLSNNPNSIAGAFEISEVEVFRGAHSFEIEGVDINEYNFLLYFCKPFNVKVGDGDII